MAMTEQQTKLAAKAIKGDEKSFSELYQLYYQKIYALAFHTLKNTADAEDVLQVTFIKAWRNISGLSNPAAFNTWIQKITINECATLLRKRKPDYSIDSGDDSAPAFELESDLMLPEVYAEQEDLSARLRRIIFTLSEVQRQTIVFFYYDNLKIPEIAEIMDCSENTVKSRLFLARKAIKTDIEEQERKSGAKFYGVPLLPFGAIFSRQISKSAIAPARAAQLYSGICAAASPAAAASVATSMAAGTKVLIGVLAGVIAVGLVAAGIIAATLIGKQQNMEQSSASAVVETTNLPETTALPETAAAQTTAAQPETEAPTEPDYAKMSAAYLQYLHFTQDGIKAFNWEGSAERENNSISFADINGDGTPEMIFLYAQRYKKHPYADVNQGRAQLRVVTYADGGASNIFETDYDIGIYQNEAGGNMSYAVFTKKGDNALYYYKKDANEACTRSIVKVVFDKNINPATETLSTVDGKDHPEPTADELEIVSNIDRVLTRSTSVAAFSDFPQGEGLTYEKAVAYLQDFAKGAENEHQTEAETDIFGEMSSKKYVAKAGGYSAASFQVNSDGSFTYIHNSGNRPPESETGSFSTPEKVSDICYKSVISSENESINGKIAYIYTPEASLDTLPEDAADALIANIFVGFGDRSKAEQVLDDPIGKYFIAVENSGIAYIDNGTF